LPVVLALASGFASGCAPFTRAEIDLVTQARRGVERVAVQDDQRDRAVAELARLRREKLDEAFDADVRQRAAHETLDPDWVVEARRAYAVGIDAYAKAQAASERAAVVRKQNLASINAALDRLQWMQSVRLKLDPFHTMQTNEEEQP
jgi:hypothetical protein